MSTYVMLCYMLIWTDYNKIIFYYSLLSPFPFCNVAPLSMSSLRLIWYQTTSLPLNMKKNTNAGAQRSNGSPTIICEYTPSIISNTNPMLAVFFNLWLGITARAKPNIISSAPTALLYHFEGNLKSNISENGNTFAYLTYSFLKSLCSSLEITGDNLVIPTKMKNTPRRTDKLFNTMEPIFYKMNPRGFPALNQTKNILNSLFLW